MAFNFVVGKEVYKLRDIQRYCKTKIIAKKIPSAADVADTKAEKVFKNLDEIIQERDLSKMIDMIEQRVNESDFTSVDLAAALLYQIIGEETKPQEKQSYDFENTGAKDEGMVRLFINMGKKQNIRPGDILGAIAGETGMPGKLIGAIDMFEKFTFVEVPVEYAKQVIETMKNSKIKGKVIDIEPASGK